MRFANKIQGGRKYRVQGVQARSNSRGCTRRTMHVLGTCPPPPGDATRVHGHEGSGSSSSSDAITALVGPQPLRSPPGRPWCAPAPAHGYGSSSSKQVVITAVSSSHTMQTGRRVLAPAKVTRMCACASASRHEDKPNSLDRAATCQKNNKSSAATSCSASRLKSRVQLTFTPRAMSSGLANSSGRWDHPLRQGMKIMAVGATCGDRRGTMINNTRCGTAGM